jgi:hypothetical protein
MRSTPPFDGDTNESTLRRRILYECSEHTNAGVCSLQALELSRHQGARAWELRAAIDLAKLLAGRAEIVEAHELLRPVFEHSVEGLGTADLKAAERLLATLCDRTGCPDGLACTDRSICILGQSGLRTIVPSCWRRLRRTIFMQQRNICSS